jgi:hypothetical protein
MTVYIPMPAQGVELEFLAEILDTCEGEIIAWCDIVASTQTEQPEYRRIEIIHDGKPFTLDYSTVKLGVERMLRDYDAKVHKGSLGRPVPTFGQLCEWLITSINDGDTTMVDGDVANAIIQYALFAKVVYA